jgi:hypothetical protein
MRKSSSVAFLVLVAIIGIAGCGSSSNPTGSQAQKSAFCGGNDAIDKASANVTTDAAFLTVLKAHRSQLDTMKNNLPAGSLGTEARQIINAAARAIAQNSTNPLNNTPSGADLDTYCGVDGSGEPLPSYFATGQGTTFCNGFLPIYQAANNASNSTELLNVFISNKAQIAQLATEVSSLPSSIQAKASATVSQAQTVIAQNSVASLSQSPNGPAQYVALYCGQNQ